jgi:hypothetical protein
MINLCKSELLRHISWMLLLAVAHFLVLYFMFTQGSPFTGTQNSILWIMIIMMLAVMFGVLQMKLHRRSNDWVYLLHRPLPPARIHLALTLAGIPLLALTLLLPAMLILVIMQVDGRFGTELRHYQILGHGALVVITGYALGQFTVFGASRLAFFGLCLLFAFLYQPMGQQERLFSHTFIALWALAAAHISFRPDTERQSESPLKLLLTEAPIVCGCYILVFVLFGTFAGYGLNAYEWARNPAANNIASIRALSAQQQLMFALDHSGHSDAMFLSQQSQLSELIPITSPQRGSYPQINQIALRDVELTLVEPHTGTSWLFSHSAMLYEGRNLQTGEFFGWLGPDGFYAAAEGMPVQRFPSVPLASGNEYLIAQHRLYQIDWQERSIRERFVNDGKERFSESLLLSENMVTLFSDRRLYIFGAEDLRDADTTLRPRATLDVSAPTGGGPPLFYVMELVDGYLVLAYIDTPRAGNLPEFMPEGRARLQVWRVVPGKAAELISDVPLSRSYSEYVLYSTFIHAPAVRALQDAFWGFKFDKPAELTFQVLHAGFPRWVIVAMLVSCVLSAALVAWLLRDSRLSPRVRWFWIILCGLCGLPAVLAFLGGHYWRGRERLLLPLRINAPMRAAL